MFSYLLLLFFCSLRNVWMSPKVGIYLSYYKIERVILFFSHATITELIELTFGINAAAVDM